MFALTGFIGRIDNSDAKANYQNCLAGSADSAYCLHDTGQSNEDERGGFAFGDGNTVAHVHPNGHPPSKRIPVNCMGKKDRACSGY